MSVHSVMTDIIRKAHWQRGCIICCIEFFVVVFLYCELHICYVWEHLVSKYMLYCVKLIEFTM